MTEQRPVLDQLNLVVGNMSEMTAFYRLLDLEVPASDGPWAGHHVEVETGDGISLELDSHASAAIWNGGWPVGTTGAILGFRLASRQAVDDRYAELVGAGHPGQQEPFDAFWGSRYAIVIDPDGNAVGLMSPADPTRRSAPPDPTT